MTRLSDEQKQTVDNLIMRGERQISSLLVIPLLDEIDRLRMELSKCSEQFDKLSTQYAEARERWQQMMDRAKAESEQLRAQVAALEE
jgi:predicted nuclease with TOPRIM domain